MFQHLVLVWRDGAGPQKEAFARTDLPRSSRTGSPNHPPEETGRLEGDGMPTNRSATKEAVLSAQLARQWRNDDQPKS